MIPTIEAITEDLAAGSINIAQANAWLHQHAEGSVNELRDHIAVTVLPGSLATCNTFEQAALESYQIADAMMKVRAS